MTGMMEKVYEESYKGYAIAILLCSSSAPGGPVSSWQQFSVCKLTSAESPNTSNESPPEEYAAILAEARAYCDREIEESKKLALTLSYRDAKNLQRALQMAEEQYSVPTLELQQKIELLLE